MTQKMPVMYFVGVTTAQSLIMRVFPLWMEELGHQVTIAGIDHPIHDKPEAYRATVERIRRDPLALGALVTTHKMDLYAAARDMFDYLDPYAQALGEISCISKNEGKLEGHAKDPISCGLSLDAIVGKGYFARTGGHVLCFGAGGAAQAMLLHLINKPDPGDRPERLIAVNRSQPRLDHMRRIVETYAAGFQVEYITNDNPRRNDELMAELPAGSLVVNATGMGKDTPGSPITDRGVFPMRGIAWDFNYRGELDFLHQARRQAESRKLRVEDGWVYFLHGWTQVIAQVLHISIDQELFDRLAHIAGQVRHNEVA